MNGKRLLIIFLSFEMVILSSCSSAVQSPTIVDASEDSCPTPEYSRSISFLIQDLNEGNDCARLTAAWALYEMGEEASPAIPALTSNLYYEGHWEIRRAAALALGNLGQKAKPAVPVLIAVLLGDFVHVQTAAAESLAKIGDKSAVPALALALQDVPDREDQYTNVQISAAEALGVLTGQTFPDSGGPGYTLDEQGTPLIVLAARNWWTHVGQYSEWVTP